MLNEEHEVQSRKKTEHLVYCFLCCCWFLLLRAQRTFCMDGKIESGQIMPMVRLWRRKLRIDKEGVGCCKRLQPLIEWWIDEWKYRLPKLDRASLVDLVILDLISFITTLQDLYRIPSQLRTMMSFILNYWQKTRAIWMRHWCRI